MRINSSAARAIPDSAASYRFLKFKPDSDDVVGLCTIQSKTRSIACPSSGRQPAKGGWYSGGVKFKRHQTAVGCDVCAGVQTLHMCSHHLVGGGHPSARLPFFHVLHHMRNLLMAYVSLWLNGSKRPVAKNYM